MIAVVGKYTGLSDAYLSIIKAMKHASIAAGRKLNIQWVEATELETNPGDEAAEELIQQYEHAWCVIVVIFHFLCFWSGTNFDLTLKYFTSYLFNLSS